MSLVSLALGILLGLAGYFLPENDSTSFLYVLSAGFLLLFILGMFILVYRCDQGVADEKYVNYDLAVVIAARNSMKSILKPPTR